MDISCKMQKCWRVTQAKSPKPITTNAVPSSLGKISTNFGDTNFPNVMVLLRIIYFLLIICRDGTLNGIAP